MSMAAGQVFSTLLFCYKIDTSIAPTLALCSLAGAFEGRDDACHRPGIATHIDMCGFAMVELNAMLAIALE
jgi:hypothetical protein